MLKRSFIFNLFLALLVVVGLLFLFFSSLDWLTNHGKETTVPLLEGKNMNEAIRLLERQGFDINVDSTYQVSKKPLEVLFQEPASGAKVKVGRTVFLTVNRKTPPSVPMPKLVGISFRNALLTLQSFRLVMGDTIYKPDLATGSVLEQWYKGKPISEGMLVPVGSKIDLVIAEGFSGVIDVPNLVGLSWQEVSVLLDSLVLTPNAVWEGTITDSATAIIYSQSPEPYNELDFKRSINQGDLIDIRIMQNPSPELLLENQSGSRKLLGEEEMGVMDSGEVPVKIIKQSQLNAKDSIRKNILPGISTPGVKPKTDGGKAVNTPITDLNAQKKAGESHTNINTKGVSVKPDKPATITKPKPKTDKPVKPLDDQIKNEYE